MTLDGNDVSHPEELINSFQKLKAIGVEGMMVDTWWGITEPDTPQEYNLKGYRKLFTMIRNTGLKIQAYEQFMLAFRNEFVGFLLDGTICELQIGLGPCGELRFPSYPARNGWVYPGVGEFQCYDKYFIKNLKDAVVVAGKPDWGTGPSDKGYNGYYARFFLDWYSGTLLHHAYMILTSTNSVFYAHHISTRVAGIHWHYNHASHAAELTVGYYNIFGQKGYAPIVDVFKKNRTLLNFTCVELATVDKDGEAASDPESLVWQVLNTGWEAGLNVAGENALPCYDRDSYNRIIQNAKRSGIIKHPNGRQLNTFTYLRLGPILMEKANLDEFAIFVMKMKKA
ncbi:hypothetical protein MIMGU_mgv1a019039mg [Erythranthe guttata]|uniref:Beta-amylase n=1 Tax=Erythranthe guttata TaxID=4155 RepID=A0A022QZX8_ERYGU|nr:hypothetical protein MIMGU_mgv1a019039mg [Erythranthe guttata]